MRVETPSRETFLVGGARSPFGRFCGALSAMSLVDLGTSVVRTGLDHTGWPIDEIDELDVGIGMIEAGLMVPARQIAFAAGLPEDLPSLTIDRACCSGLSTIGLAARAIGTGTGSALCLGAEAMSRTPRLLHGSRGGTKPGDLEVEDLLLLRSPLTGTTIARYVADVALEHGIGRTAQDEWALQSHRRYFAALERGFFEGEVVPVDTGDGQVTTDEPPRRDTSMEKLTALRTVRNSATITAGNAPGLNDGACMVVVANRETTERVGATPLARVHSYLQTAGAADSSAYLPGLAVKRLAGEAGIPIGEIDVIEINEAYAATPLVSIRRMADGDDGLEQELQRRTNGNGGAVAIGHPIGASGARLALTAARRLHDEGGRWAAVAICGGFGQADAVLLEYQS